MPGSQNEGEDGALALEIIGDAMLSLTGWKERGWNALRWCLSAFSLGELLHTPLGDALPHCLPMFLLSYFISVPFFLTAPFRR